MALEVLLRRTIEGVGDVGEIVKVKPGFARNYLFPNRYASPVTPDAMRRIAKDKATEMVRQKDLAKKRDLLKEALADLTLTIETRAGEDGHLYGSVNARHVTQHLATLGYEFQERHVQFETVRELGQYEVTLDLGAGVKVPIELWVVQDAADIESMKEAAARAAEEAAAAEAAAGEESLIDDLASLDTTGEADGE